MRVISKRFKERERIIGRTVIHDKDFSIGELFLEYRLYSTNDVFPHIIRGNNHGHRHRGTF